MALLLFYPVSAGPLLILQSGGYLPQPVFDLLRSTVYAPLVWCYHSSETFRTIWDPFERTCRELGRR
jgi:hypothetical protein